MSQDAAVRTADEIIRHYREVVSKRDMFGFEAQVLLPYLSVDQVREFVKPDADLSGWKQTPLERDAILAELRDYMAFAWGKVLDHRGISANRSTMKMGSWLWVLGDDELSEAMETMSYAQYGAPRLKAVCDKYGFLVPNSTAIARMIAGEPCTPGCDEGCGE